MILCTKCGHTKKHTEFTPSHIRKNNKGTCRECNNVSQRSYRARNHEEIKRKRDVYQEANKERISKVKKEYRNKNKDKIREYSNREDVKKRRAAYCREYRGGMYDGNFEYYKSHET